LPCSSEDGKTYEEKYETGINRSEKNAAPGIDSIVGGE
jgi:hypothetical protein